MERALAQSLVSIRQACVGRISGEGVLRKVEQVGILEDRALQGPPELKAGAEIKNVPGVGREEPEGPAQAILPDRSLTSLPR